MLKAVLEECGCIADEVFMDSEMPLILPTSLESNDVAPKAVSVLGMPRTNTAHARN
jgi:hypothetical protein